AAPGDGPWRGPALTRDPAATSMRLSWSASSRRLKRGLARIFTNGGDGMKERMRRDLTREKVAEASRLFRMAYARQLEGDIDRALLLYEKSIRLHASAEAHAYLGWARSTR